VTEARRRLRKAVEDSPGIHFNDLVRRTDLARGQVQYHLRTLRSDDRVVREEVSGRTHYYAPGYDHWEREAIALLRRETPRAVVGCLLERSPATPATVADEVGIARSTLEHHLDALEAADVVAKHRDDRGRVTLSLVRPERTVSLLESVVPSVPASMVDRFTRLVDDVLEGGSR
jgi:predicted transcriptional regulator